MFSGSTFGNSFRVTTFGESHGTALGVVIDGCPSELEINEESIVRELERRKPGQSRLVSPRKEDDVYRIVSGLFEGKTTGAPLTATFANFDVKSKDYDNIKDTFRPGHADYTYFKKYRHRDYRGGGRSSARETISRVFAGAVAKQILATFGITIRAGVSQIGKIKAENFNWDLVESNDVRSLDPIKIEEMVEQIEVARKNRESVGGIVHVEALGVMPGLGEPVFQKLDAVIAGAMLSIPAVKAVEFGAGFACVEMLGSEMNDEMSSSGFLSNNHGGILGGLSSGETIVARIAIKPTSSLPKPQRSIDTSGEEVEVVTKGRHDPCVAIRAVPIAEAMMALSLVDLLLEQLKSTSVKYGFAPPAAK